MTETECIEMEAEVASPPAASPWGLWATLGFCILMVIAFLAIQIVVVVGFIVMAMLRDSDIDVLEYGISLDSNGLYFSVATLATAPVCVAMLLVFARFRKEMTLGQYFCFNRVRFGQIVVCVALLYLWLGLVGWISILSGRDDNVQYMLDIYASADPVPLFWIAMILGAPLLEEFFFRGFLFTGLQHSRLGPAGAVLLTSLAWASIHVQYDLFDMSTIFVDGLLIGAARVKCNSIYPCFVMHAFINFLAIMGVAFYPEIS